jgi:hypothetical protein
MASWTASIGGIATDTAKCVGFRYDISSPTRALLISGAANAATS